MPNWTETHLKIRGGRDNCLNLLNRFVSIEQEGRYHANLMVSRYGIHLIKYSRKQPTYRSPLYRPRFYRSFTFKTAKEVFDELIQNYDEVNQEVEMLVHCAWSAEGCLIFGEYDDGAAKITDMCKLYGVSVEVYSDEPGLGFTEEFTVLNNGQITQLNFYQMDHYLVCPECDTRTWVDGYTYKEQMLLPTEVLNNLLCYCCGHVGLIRNMKGELKNEPH